MIQTAGEVESLGVHLGPALHEACGDRLGEIEWFRSAWQRSGAATGRTWWRLPSGDVIPAIAKVPVGYLEWRWTTELGAADPMRWDAPDEPLPPVPRVLASGYELGGYDIAWLVVERVAGTTLRDALGHGSLTRLFKAVAMFHAMSTGIRPINGVGKRSQTNWAKLLTRARESCVDNAMEDQKRWLRAIDATCEALPVLTELWDNRRIDTWCHGDVHPGNAMFRSIDGGETAGPCVLIDLGMIHAGHWVEDALYMERLHWGRPEMLCGIHPEAMLASTRREYGLAVEPDDAVIADVRRILMGATSPAFLEQEGSPAYLHAALEHVEALLPRVAA